MPHVLKKLLPEPLPKTTAGLVRALREILQSLALLGLWRARFFEHSAFYGGTALRMLYGLDRFSEDLDFSLLKPSASFDFQVYASALERELNAFGFVESTIESAFLKGNTYRQLIMIEAPAEILKEISKEAILKIKLEIDIQPPGGYDTEMKYIFSPIQYAVRSYTLPSLFAGKIHALLCRKWKTRVKGRDWYDFVWYASRYPSLNLHHLEERMRQSGHYQDLGPLTRSYLLERIFSVIDELNLNAARQEVMPFVNDVRSLDVWSKDFFKAAAERIATRNI
ncbi:MAG: nucleotidyl transferase AbiEii/AbiGii toxin family protein [Deltaproteobacteria bacterium]|nr:nucleotidyl transferase AbiEii/AbiGii toxin family protein [Deltaproteobacteria bacterium]MBL7113886.1 nucleotidyl transferase AbiEii/AbiGii toxin family protein [Bacteroidales bacterium]